MSLNLRKILIVLGFVVIVLAFSYLIYLFFFSGPLVSPPVNVNGGPLVNGGSLPVSGPYTNGNVAANINGQLPVSGNLNANVNANVNQQLGQPATAKPLTQTLANDMTLAPNGQDLLYYNPQDGRFYRLTPDGKLIKLSDEVFHDVTRVNWSPNKNQAILEYPDSYKIVYDFEKQKQIATLPRHWQDFSFSPDGSRFIGKSLGQDENNRWLMVANNDGSGAQIVETIGTNADKVEVNWSPNNQMVATYTESKNFDNQNLYFIGLHGENFKSLTIDGRGFQSKWSPQGDGLLYSIYSSTSDYKPTLWLANVQGDSVRTKKNLNINTWAEKCTFYNNDTVYCAVPQKLESGAGLSPELARTTPDDIYEINLTTGLANKLNVATGGHTVEKITISADGQYLYFTDINDGRLYQINLK